MEGIKRYFYKLQNIIGETSSADEINDRWTEVLNRLDEISVEYAKELQGETKIKYLKFEKEHEDIWQFPPFRLLAMNIILSYWVGWLSVPKKLVHASAAERIGEAYNIGAKTGMLEDAATREDGGC
ncbi:MAG: hypothetical protein ACRD8W_18605 [Nitrososphaeraceae archaeon]